MKYTTLLVSSLLVTLFCFILWINLTYLEGIPHVPDEQAYLFMAKMLSQGRIADSIAIPSIYVDFFPGILSVENNTWLFQYPLGHPLLLSIGVLLGFPNVIPPFIAVLTIVLLCLIAQKIYDTTTSLFVCLLAFISPFFLENAASFMSHTTASFYLVLSLFFLIFVISSPKNASLSSFLSGYTLGLLFNTRPLTALPFFGLFFLIVAWTSLKHKVYLPLFLFLLGFGSLFSFWLFYNSLTTGSSVSSQYFHVNNSLFISPLSLLDGHTFLQQWNNLLILFHNFGPMLFNWPVGVTYTLLIVVFLLRQASKWDYLFFLLLFTLPLVYFFYNGTFLMYGPRFWYEITPFVFLLTARSFSLLYHKFRYFTICSVVLLFVISFAKLFSFLPTTDPHEFSPLSLEKLRGFNYTDNRIERIVKTAQIHNAVVLVNDCSGNWWCYGSVFAKNTPSLDGDIVYLKNVDRGFLLTDYYPTRRFYTIDYYELELRLVK